MMKRIITAPVKIQSKDGRIIGEYLPNGNIKVFKGSFFRNFEVNSIRLNVKNERLYLINNGYIVNHQLTKDYIFNNPSIAISTLLGRMETGNQAFVTMDNIELGSYLEIDSIAAYEQNRGLSYLSDEVVKITKNKIEEKKLVDEDDEDGLISTANIEKEVIVEASYKPIKRPNKIDSKRLLFERNPEKAKKSIILADYKCELNESHVTFLTKNGKPYMEAHHLIPLSAQTYFTNSLDVDANIICLCPNCHRKLHYGKYNISDLRKIYEERLHYLRKSMIDITFEELASFYK